jgi:lysyl-tRNA synthetase class 2
MTAANFITARDLFLGHHWKRYPGWNEAFQNFLLGRVVGRDKFEFVLRDERQTHSPESRLNSEQLCWHIESFREPKAGESAPPVQEVLRVGDWVGISGQGEVILFAPCARPVAVQECDLLAEKAVKWSLFLLAIRQFFQDREFFEISTPTLAVSPGTEPFLDPLKVETEFGGFRETRYLITSPEFHLKKVVGAGVPRIFEIAKCFRNRESGHQHRIEFHMLEWYRSFADLDQIAQDVEALIRLFCPDVHLVRTNMPALFQRFLGFQLNSNTTRDQLAALAEKHSIRTLNDDGFDDLFHKLFLERIEPYLNEVDEGNPVLVTDYPPTQAALARIGENGFAQRFEVYWHGLELCNAFHELNDPSENQRRLDGDLYQKKILGREPVPLDSELMRTFEHGMPPAAGIALGLERLFMAVYKTESIDLTRPFATFV